jgi:accessory gene regulator protein AgrB
MQLILVFYVVIAFLVIMSTARMIEDKRGDYVSKFITCLIFGLLWFILIPFVVWKVLKWKK